MFWKARYKLHCLKKKSDPTKEFRNALSYKLKERYDILYHNMPEKRSAVMFLRYAVVALSLILILSVGTGVYAFTSSNVNVTHPLYPVKRSLEKVQKILARTPEQKANVDLEHLTKRRAELEQMRVKGKINDKAIAALDEAEEENIKELEKINSVETKKQVIQKISENDLIAVANLQKIKNQKSATAEQQKQKEDKIQARLDKIQERWDKLAEQEAETLDKQVESQAELGEKINEHQAALNSLEN